jgi:hypothetical protein
MHAETVPVPEFGSTVIARFEDGPLQGSRADVEVIEGRPPKTIDSPAPNGGTCRYCLAGWVQSGRTAAYTFLYLVEPSPHRG